MRTQEGVTDNPQEYLTRRTDYQHSFLLGKKIETTPEPKRKKPSKKQSKKHSSRLVEGLAHKTQVEIGQQEKVAVITKESGVHKSMISVASASKLDEVRQSRNVIEGLKNGKINH